MNLSIQLLTFTALATAAQCAFAAGIDLSKLPPPSDKKGLTFEKDIKPILEESCFRCHGEERQRGDLRLDTLAAAMSGGENGKVIQPGKSKESPLVIAISHLDEEKAMPPKPREGRGPGGPGGRGGPGGFGPGMMLAPQMVSQGDKNSDQKLSKEEFTGLADTWFDKMDSEKNGKLTQEQFAGKLNELLPPPQGFGPRGGNRPEGGPPGGRGGFGPGRFIGPGLFTATDADKDGTLTRAEFKGAFAKWHSEWDTDKSGALTEEKIREGLNKTLPRPNFGGGPGGRGPGGPGRPGGPGEQGGPGGNRPPAKPLTPEQVSVIRAWIDQGAK